MLDDPWSYYTELEESNYTDTGGKYHLVYKYYSDSPFPDGKYWFSAEPVYDEDSYNNWVPFDFYYIINKG
jgi:hypothetical protein